MKSTPDLTNQIHLLTLNSKPQFAFTLKVLMPSTVFPSLFTSSTEPPSSLLEPAPGSYFSFFIHMQSNRVRHPDFTHVTSALPWLGIHLMELSHVLETRSSICAPSSGFTRIRHSHSRVTWRPPQHSHHYLQSLLHKKQLKATKKAFMTCTLTTCCGGACYRNNPDQYS